MSDHIRYSIEFKLRETSMWFDETLRRHTHLISNTSRFRHCFADVIESIGHSAVLGNVAEMKNVRSSGRNRHTECIGIHHFGWQSHSTEKFSRCWCIHTRTSVQLTMTWGCLLLLLLDTDHSIDFLHRNILNAISQILEHTVVINRRMGKTTLTG